MTGWRVAAALFGAFLAPAGASALQDAIVQRDVLRLEELSRGAGAPEETKLAGGAALALRHRDQAALAILEPLSRTSADKDIRAGACFAAGDIYLRQTRYAEAHAALACVEEQSGKALTGEPKQIFDDTAALADEKPMTVESGGLGKVSVRRDEAGLMGLRVTINGQNQRAILDTDASFSVVSRSTAEHLGLRILEMPLSIVTASREAQPMRLALADRVQFGDAVLSNVVFAVLPDKAVRFGPNYEMRAVIGLPVLVALRRIALARENGSEVLLYGAGPGAARSAEPNLALSGLDPFVLAKDEKTGAVLRLALDTAADKSSLNATAVRDFPALAEGSTRGFSQWRGAGGAASDPAVRRLSELHLLLAGRPVVLKRVEVRSADEGDRHGMLGQDALRQGHGWVLDFDAMRFSIED